MSSLPDPKGFRDHKTSYTTSRPKESDKKSYDLQKIHNNFMEDRNRVDEKILVKQGNELIDYKFYMSTPHPAAAKHLFGYSQRDESFTIHLKDKEGVQTVAVRSSIDKDGNPVKWKTYGSKKFIPHKVEDDFIFLFSGMAEIVIMEMLGLSYVGLQADGMARHLPQELKELTEGKTVVVLQDNDSSFRDNVTSYVKSFFKRSEVLVIDFERVLNRELKHGYDFRDFCNEIKDAKKVMERLEIEIICLQDKSHVR